MKGIFALTLAATLSKKVAQGTIAAYAKRFGAKPSTLGANPWARRHGQARAVARHDPRWQIPVVARVTWRAAASHCAMSR